MAGKSSKTTIPGRGYSAEDDTATGRKAGYGADSTNPPAGMAPGAESESEDTGTESDEAPSGRVQGG